MNVLHLSHTDIRGDSRILKEAIAVADLPHARVFALGISAGSLAIKHSIDHRLIVASLDLHTSVMQRLPRYLRLVLFAWAWMAIEAYVRSVFYVYQRKIKIIHCHDYYMLPAAVVASWLVGAKLVYDAHELHADKNGSSRMGSLAVQLIERCAWSSVSLFISVSPSIVEWYGKRYGEKESLLILNSPVVTGSGDAATPYKSSSYLRDKFGIDPDALIFIYVGLFSKGRGIDIYLNAFSDSSVRSHVVLMGFGEMGEIIDAASRENGKIHVHPPVSHQNVVDIVRSADFGLCLVENVSLSTFYALPNKLFEYAFSRVAVIASRFPDMESLITRYSLGLCCDPTVSDLVSTLRKIEDGGVITNRCVDLSDISWRSQSSKLLAAYEHLL